MRVLCIPVFLVVFVSVFVSVCFAVLALSKMRFVETDLRHLDARNSFHVCAARISFVTSIQRALTGIDFEDKEYKLYLLRVNPQSRTHKTKVRIHTPVCAHTLPPHT